jgi:hypothetical protein
MKTATIRTNGMTVNDLLKMNSNGMREKITRMERIAT